MNCSIVTDNKGNITDVKAPNGASSLLYKAALTFTNNNQNQALDIWAVSQTPSFVEEVLSPIKFQAANAATPVIQQQREVAQLVTEYLKNKGQKINVLPEAQILEEARKRTTTSLRQGDKVYGFYDPKTKEIYLTEEVLTSENLVHELYHAYKPLLKDQKDNKAAQQVLKQMEGLALQLIGGEQVIRNRFNTPVEIGEDSSLAFKAVINENANSLEDFRRNIDIIDSAIVESINEDFTNLVLERNKQVLEIARYKQKEGIQILDSNREKALLQRVSEKAKEKGVSVNKVVKTFKEILVNSKELQKDFLSLGIDNKSSETQEFFSDVVLGKSNKFKPNKPWKPLLSFTAAQKSFKSLYDKYKGNFDEHIATSIPTFRETQIKVGEAIVSMLSEEGLVYDIGGSEGGFVKSITESSKGKIRSKNLDPNPDMKKVHESTPVEGSEFIQEAFYEGFDNYKKHVPQEKADVVHESMVFQFITPERKDFVKEVKDNYIKKDGIFLTEEKLLPRNEAEWVANEAKKAEYKNEYYSNEQLVQKSEEVLVGMKKNQTYEQNYVKILQENFKYVAPYWNSGNFKGYIATDSKVKLDEFLNKIGGEINSEYSSSEISPTTITPEIASQLTEDGQGNFVFNHFSQTKRKVIKKGTGENIITARDESAALSAVGGLAMYYTMDAQTESGVGNIRHTVLIPKEKVYDTDTDPLGFEAEARQRFNEARPGQGFNSNYRTAFITQVAIENGFEMTVSRWRNNELRAQTTKELTPAEESIDFKERLLPTFEVGDRAMISGVEATVTAVDGQRISYKALDGTASGVALNNEMNRRSITKLDFSVNNTQLSSSVYNPRPGESLAQYRERLIEEAEALLLQQNSIQYFERLAKENGLNEKETKTFIQRVQKFFKDFSNWLVNQLGVTNVTAEQVAQMTQRELFDTITTSMLRGDFSDVIVSKSESTNPSFEDMLDFNVDGGVLEIGKIKGAKRYSVLHLKVDENKRKQGIASKLLQRALDETNGELSGQASNDMAVGLNYKLGMRAFIEGRELTLEETKKERDSRAGESINMLLPESQRGDSYKANVKKEGVVSPSTKVKGYNQISKGGATIHFKDGTIELIETVPESRGQGAARALLQDFTQMADQNKQTLRLMVAPRESETTESGLVALYKSVGFSFDRGSDFEMIRYPKRTAPSLLDTNGEPKLQQVLHYIEQSNAEGTPSMTQTEKQAVENMLRGLKLTSSNELLTELNKIFPNGQLSKDALDNSFIFTRGEVQRMTQENIDNLLTLKRQLNEQSEIVDNIDFNPEFVFTTNTKNKYGKTETTNPLIIEKEIAAQVAGIQDRAEFDRAFTNMEYTSVVEQYLENEAFAQEMYIRFSTMKQLPKVTMVEGQLADQVESNKATEIEHVLSFQNVDFRGDVQGLLMVTEDIWDNSPQEIETILRGIEKKGIKAGIDLTGLTAAYENRTKMEMMMFLSALNNVNAVQSQESLEAFIEAYKDFFQVEDVPAIQIEEMPPHHSNKTLVYVENELSEYSMFNDYSLVKVDNNIYQRVNKVSNENLVEILYTNAITENNRVLPNSAYFQNGQVNNAALVDPNNKPQIIQNIQKFAEDNITALNIEESNIDTDVAQQLLLYKYYYNNPINTPVENNLQRDLFMLKDFNGDYIYLSTDFLHDFQVRKLQEQNKNSEMFQKVYNSFFINEKGLQLKSTDVISLRDLQKNLTLLSEQEQSNLKNYAAISKDTGIKELFTPQAFLFADNYKKLERDYYQNNPKALPLFKGDYANIDGETIVSKTATSDFLRIKNRLFEKADGNSVETYYRAIPIKDGNFYDLSEQNLPAKVENKAPVHKSETQISHNKLYSRAEESIINQENFDCQ